mgnify:CR=1 FL=1|tara:strand:+ start:9821 stop:12565 length:2745 start_codon:yes stop_codon:yes gene_type:complete
MTKIRNTVGAYKILLSANPIFTTDLASKIKTSTDLLGMYGSDKYSTVFSSEDAGFIELKHDFKFKAGGNNQGAMINLKTYDPGLKFLNDLYFDFTSRSLQRLADDEDLEQTKLKNYYHKVEELKTTLPFHEININALTEQLEKAQVEFSELGENLTEADEVKYAELGKLIERSGQDLAEATKQAQELQREIDSYQDSIANIVTHRSLPKVHVMYGVGNDIRHWAGPFECYLGETKYSNNGKEETVEYIMATDLTSLAFTESDIRSPDEWKTFFSEAAIPVMAYNLNPADVNTGYGLFDSKDFDKKSYSVHDCLVKLMSNYLYKLGIKNHLIALPNLESILSACIDSAISRVIHKNAGSLRSEGWNFGYTSWVTSYRPIDSYEGTEREQVLFSRVSNFFHGDTKQLQYLLGLQDQKIEFAGMSKILTSINFQVIQEIFSTIGAGKRLTNVPSSDGPITEFTTGLSKIQDKTVKVNNPFGGRLGKVEAQSIYSISFANKYSWGDKATVDWLAPIKDLIEGINSNASNRYISFTAAFLSNKKIIDKVKSKFGGGTYVGYISPAYGATSPPIDDSPFLLLGDQNIINSLVYGEFARVARDPRYDNADFRSQDLDFITQPVGNIQDPFWTLYGNDNYINEMYSLIKTKDVLNLGYHNGIIERDNEGKHLQELAAQIPDEFGYFRDTNDLAAIYEEKLPIFRAGVTNPNVLSYSFDSDKFIYGSLVGTIREVYYNVSKAYLRKNNPITFNGTLSPEELREKLLEVGDALRAKRLFSGAGLTSRTGTSTPTVPLEMYDEIAKLFLADSLGPARRTRKGKSSSVLAFFMLFMDCFEREHLGTLKTLPMFHISNHVNILQPCLSLIKSTRRAHTSKFHRGDSSVSDFYSGQFRLLGFAHTINRSSAYSEFSVQKDIVGDMNNE